MSSHDSIGINLISDRPLGVIVHNAAIGGSVTQQGGGGGVNCDSVGFFKVIQSPVFSTYEDSTVGGDLRITGYRSCWQGVARVQVGGDLVEINNQLADPDAIEIVLNHVTGDLVCRGNSMVWDSGETGPGLFPRPATQHCRRPTHRPVRVEQPHTAPRPSRTRPLLELVTGCASFGS